MKSSNREPLSNPKCTGARTHLIHHRKTPTNISYRSVCRFGDMCRSARCPLCHPNHCGTTRQTQREGGRERHAAPRQCTLAVVSAPAEGKRAPRWAVCATGGARAGAHQGQTSLWGETDKWWTVGTTHGGAGHRGLTHTETQRGRLWAAGGQRRVDSKNTQKPPSNNLIMPTTGQHGRANGTPCHIQHSPGTSTTGLRERGNDTSKSTGRNGRQKEATGRNMRREERVTVQGPVKKQQPDGTKRNVT